MRVYFVVNNNLKKNLNFNEGDFLFCREHDSLYVFLVLSINPLLISNLARCKYVINQDLYFSEKIIYSFSNEEARIGDIDILEHLLKLFNSNTIIKGFICNLLKILMYKEDRIQGSIITKLYLLANLNKQANPTPSKIKSDNFLNYFSLEMITEFIKAFNNYQNLRSAFSHVRKHQPLAFRNALIDYKKNNKEESLTIYSNINLNNCLEISEKKRKCTY